MGIAARRCRGQKKAWRNYRSGRKNRGKRKPEDFFGNRKVARSDNPEVVGSNPSPATKNLRLWSEVFFFIKLLFRFPLVGIAAEVSAKNVPPARFINATTPAAKITHCFCNELFFCGRTRLDAFAVPAALSFAATARLRSRAGGFLCHRQRRAALPPAVKNLTHQSEVFVLTTINNEYIRECKLYLSNRSQSMHR